MKQRAPRSLIVEDDPGYRSFLKRFLISRGIKATAVDTGQKAIQSIRANPPDLVLLDVLLPDASGIETLSRVREFAPSLFVIVLTSLGDAKDRARVRKLAPSDYFVKPFSLEFLRKKLDEKLLEIFPHLSDGGTKP